MLDNNNPKSRGAPSFDYIDLLAATLTEHEKNLDRLIERLKTLVEATVEEDKSRVKNLLSDHFETQQGPTTGESPKSVAYIKLIRY